MSVTGFIAGASGLKTIMDTLKGFKDINDATVRNNVAIELQGKILAAYADQFALTEKVSELEKEITAVKGWETQKERYELKDIGGRGFAYIVKATMRGTDPPHAICTNCYEQGKKSILQFNGELRVFDQEFTCPLCKTAFKFYKADMDTVLQG